MEINIKFEDQGYIKFLAPAKINRFLKIISKRDDGYHNLQSCFQMIDLCDEIYFKVRDDNLINLQYISKSFDDDLIIKAAKIILNKTDFGIDIALNKKIPVGAGLGGGSSDAASTLLALNKIFNLGFKLEQLEEIGLTLGADVPFFIRGQNAWVEGIGEKITPIELKKQTFILAVPDIHIVTKQVFSSLKLTKNAIPLKMSALISDDEIDTVPNDLEEVSLRLFPELKDTKNWLMQYGHAKMTGTGSSFFCGIKKSLEQDLKFYDKPAKITVFKIKSLKVHPFMA
jgi:4-diphosphocytidyl-2-C-methyl-D-erythritol kinase